MGIRSQHIVSCDWCHHEPCVAFDQYADAYMECLRLAKHESWLAVDRGGDLDVLLCPDCAAEGRA